ncbi:MAG: glycosyltransferase [Candidatus Dormibacteraeota bacterium]|nr:glycosyltransferase [Candidatus Dormibacteraeota bacterium]
MDGTVQAVRGGIPSLDTEPPATVIGRRFTPRPRRRLSVIVPAYRDRERIVPNLIRLGEALDATGLEWEAVVIVDGDIETYGRAVRYARRIGDDKIRIHGYQANRGKGFALRYGMSLASGQLVTLLDSDMDVAPEEIGRMVRLLDLYNADIVVGSKRHPLSRVHYPLFRRVQSACYQTLVRLLFRVKVRDTQTGLKLMRRDVARRVLRVAVVKRFAFDLELLALATRFGYRRIIEAPVEIDYHFSSTANLRAAFHVLWDTLAIFYRLRVRRWYDRRNAPGLAMMLAGLPKKLVVDERTEMTADIA